MIPNIMQKSRKEGGPPPPPPKAFLFNLLGIEDPILNAELLPFNIEGS